MPSMPFNGVRISWLMFARKSLLALLASSAASLAASSNSRDSRDCVTSRPIAYTSFSSGTVMAFHWIQRYPPDL